jgi:hypothetical protein
VAIDGLTKLLTKSLVGVVENRLEITIHLWNWATGIAIAFLATDCAAVRKPVMKGKVQRWNGLVMPHQKHDCPFEDERLRGSLPEAEYDGNGHHG